MSQRLEGGCKLGLEGWQGLLGLLAWWPRHPGGSQPGDGRETWALGASDPRSTRAEKWGWGITR